MSILPQNKRREVKDVSTGLRIWLYAAPYVGKTTFADEFPDPINLNTDGNIKFVSMPYVTISPDSDSKKTAWEFFKATIDELLKGNHDFETIVVDLLEDIYQYCRDHHNAAQGWTHESEAGFGRAYDLIRNDFLGELKRLSTSGYNVIFLSHQTDKIVKSRTGRETTIFQPNLTEKVAIKVSGLVDMTARAFMDVKETEAGIEDIRLIQMKPTANEFNSGGRITTDQDTIALDYDVFMEAVKIKRPAVKRTAAKTRRAKVVEAPVEEAPVEEVPVVEETPVEEAPKPVVRTRTRKREVVEAEVVEETPAEEKPVEEKPRRTRRTRTLD